MKFLLDDLSGEPTRALIERHLAGMRANSPPESVHALEIDQLRQADVSFWSVWLETEIAGCGALKQLDARRGELKSMRVADAFLSIPEVEMRRLRAQSTRPDVVPLQGRPMVLPRHRLFGA